MRALLVLLWCAVAATYAQSIIPSNLIIMQAKDGRLERVEGGIGGGGGTGSTNPLFSLNGNVPHLFVFFAPVNQYLSSGSGSGSSGLAADQSRLTPVTSGSGITPSGSGGDPVEEGAPMSQGEEEAVVMSEQVDSPASENTTPAAAAAISSAAMAVEMGGGGSGDQPQPSGGYADSPPSGGYGNPPPPPSGGYGNSPPSGGYGNNEPAKEGSVVSSNSAVVGGSSAPSASVTTSTKPEEITMMTPEALSKTSPPTTSETISVPPVNLMSLMAAASGRIPGRLEEIRQGAPQPHQPFRSGAPLQFNQNRMIVDRYWDDNDSSSSSLRPRRAERFSERNGYLYDFIQIRDLWSREERHDHGF